MSESYIFSMHRVGKVVPPKREILKNISLSFFDGAKIGVLGLNGSGKSSLLKIMAGVDKEFLGEAAPRKGVRIGYLQQEPKLDPNKTVREIVEEAVSDTKAMLKRFDEISMISRLVLRAVCEQSISMPTRLISLTTARPKAVRPRSWS